VAVQSALRAVGAEAQSSQRLRASPNFTLSLAMDGRAYLAKDVEPYVQYWISDRERMLWSLFACRGGARVETAIDASLRLTPSQKTIAERARLAKAINGMRQAGVLLSDQDDVSRYDAAMAADYLTHRPFPRAVASHIIDAAPIGPATRVLDLAAGPGSLALELAQASPNVTMMELSKGFVAAARKAARKRRLPLEALNESCNRLVHHTGAYDVITVSQALHWLDDVLVCKGVCRLLNDDGSFFVIHGALTLAADHPLSHILGDSTPLGDKQRHAFVDEVEPLLRRVTLLFDALDAPDVARHDPAHVGGTGTGRIVPVAASLFRQTRPIGEGFARAFLSPAHLTATGQSPQDFWADTARRCASATDDQLLGVQEWAVLHFRRGGQRMASGKLDPATMVEIGWGG
jgi:ubiquinone/menaquinone biosynthesis C-methylase UbiE